MKTKPYHHGDLRTVMIEKGIELIDEHGVKGLSLRKIAAACGVSHSAPYSHFASKDELLSAIEKHITDKFAMALKASVGDAGETLEGLIRIGCAYVLFFARNPEYFRFIVFHADIKVGEEHEYEPYDFLREFILKLFEATDSPKELWLKTFIAHFAMIHGLASVAVMTGSSQIPAWEKLLPDILSTNYLLIK